MGGTLSLPSVHSGELAAAALQQQVREEDQRKLLVVTANLLDKLVI